MYFEAADRGYQMLKYSRFEDALRPAIWVRSFRAAVFTAWEEVITDAAGGQEALAFDAIGQYAILLGNGSTVFSYGDTVLGSAVEGAKMDSAASDGRLDPATETFSGTWRVFGAGINNGRKTGLLSVRIV